LRADSSGAVIRFIRLGVLIVALRRLIRRENKLFYLLFPTCKRNSTNLPQPINFIEENSQKNSLLYAFDGIGGRNSGLGRYA
tara:strand:+ start:255 stop:500 length:246 start_codon:yes stop_codon:yes gene_type:complete